MRRCGVKVLLIVVQHDVLVSEVVVDFVVRLAHVAISGGVDAPFYDYSHLTGYLSIIVTIDLQLSSIQALVLISMEP